MEQASGSAGQCTDVLGRYMRLSAADVKRLPRQTKIDLLRELRCRQLRCPSLVSLCATELLAGGDLVLGDEKWAIAEQGIIASLENGNIVAALDFYKMLRGKFT